MAAPPRSWGTRLTPLTPPSPLIDLLQAGLSEIRFAPHQVAALAPPLAKLAELTSAWAARMNLTAHRSAEAVAQHLVLGSISIGRLLLAPASLVDIGSGAGFPGLPLALLWPECRVLLVEARERRHHFQKQALRHLGLARVEVWLGRAERLRPRPAELVIAQAVARPSEALRLMLPWAEPGATLALPLASPPPQFSVPEGIDPQNTHLYRLALGGGERALWLGKRSSPLDSHARSV